MAIGIELDSGEKGCDGGTDCMKMCQTLCCLTKGCKIAMMHKDKDKNCEVSCDIYKEEETLFKCYLYGSGSRRSGSSVTSSCYTEPNSPNYDHCLSIAADSDFKFDKSTFDYLKSLQTCSSSGKKLLATGIKKVDVPLMGSKLIKRLEKKMSFAKEFKSRLDVAVKKAGGAAKFKRNLIERLQK